MSTAPASADAEEWISRADAAELARRSQDVIKRDQKEHGLETRPRSQREDHAAAGRPGPHRPDPP